MSSTSQFYIGKCFLYRCSGLRLLRCSKDVKIRFSVLWASNLTPEPLRNMWVPLLHAESDIVDMSWACLNSESNASLQTPRLALFFLHNGLTLGECNRVPIAKSCVWHLLVDTPIPPLLSC